MFTRITANPHQMGSVPCVRGLRIPVATVLAMLDGRSGGEIPCHHRKAASLTQKECLNY